MTPGQRTELTLNYFIQNDTLAETELEYRDPFSLIVAVILSAQCTDKRVNMITPALFGRFPDAESMSKASPEELFEFIRSCSYPNNKARHLAGMARMLVNEFGGQVPSDPGELQRLPGVGRKTAHVIASVVFRKEVLAVDTHVFRVANRIGLSTNAKTPRSVEDQLTRHIPPQLLYKAHHWLLLHGRYTCRARTPLCSECGLREFCRYYATQNRKRGK